MMNLLVFGPELFMFFSAAIFLVFSMGSASRPVRDYRMAVLLSGVGLGVCLVSLTAQGDLFAAAYRVDFFSQVFKILLAAGLFLVMYLCGELKGIASRHHPEFYLLLFTSTLALMLLVSGVHLLSMYIALELSSYCLYILVALNRDPDMGIEAGVKYFLTGISASALMIFGLALLYSASGTLYVKDLFQVFPGLMDRPMAVIGLLFTLSGFLFKLAVFPFHFWAPDVYQGAANQVAAYIATVSKVAAAAVLIRTVAVSGAANSSLTPVLTMMAVATMTIANLAALGQKDLKRLLAYSSIAQAGYILIGVLSVGPAGQSGVVFYALALLLMKLTVFLIVIRVAPDGGGNPAVNDLAGLHQRSPILALALMISLFSLAGIPPFIGFTGKFMIFTAAMQAGHFYLVLAAMINVVISLYYYLFLLKAAYLLPPNEASAPLQISSLERGIVGFLILLMVGGGLYPAGFITVADATALMLMYP
ncbi:MAG: NADH-quinone oxidoreductase subunit N [Pseudomonadota bacterium]